MSGEIVNLNKARKAKARTEAKGSAQANRAKFGRSKGERLRDAHESRRADQVLELHRLEPPAKD